MRILIDDGADLFVDNIKAREFLICDQCTTQGGLFSRAIGEDREQPISLEDAVKNIAVIEAVFRAAQSGGWEEIQHQ